MTDQYAEMLRAKDKVRKLLAKASGNDNQAEAEAFLNKARQIAAKHGFSIHGVKPSAPLSMSERIAAARASSSGISESIRKAYPGTDDEDYSKYARRERRDEDD